MSCRHQRYIIYIALEALRSIASVRIMLCVARSEVFRGRFEILLIERGIFERSHRLFVRLQLLNAGGTGLWHCSQQSECYCSETKAKHVSLHLLAEYFVSARMIGR